jgi:hypothetical protein
VLHPGLAEVYRRKVEKLTEALNKDHLRAEAAESLRSMIRASGWSPRTESWRSSLWASWRGFWR